MQEAILTATGSTAEMRAAKSRHCAKPNWAKGPNAPASLNRNNTGAIIKKKGVSSSFFVVFNYAVFYKQ